MKYCLDFNKKYLSLLNEVDEITIQYNKRDTSLVEFLQKYSNKRVNILISDLEDFIESKEIDKIKGIKEKYPELNFALQLPRTNNFSFIKELRSMGLKFFISDFAFDWDIFLGLVNLGVSDIYVTDNLGFELDKCAKIAHENNIAIRVFPNVAQSKWSNTPGEKKFFIRPEDLDFYEEFVDVVEFFGEGAYVPTIFKVYFFDKKWHGNLNEIILNLGTNLDSRFILPQFAESRIKCGKKCIKQRTCNICTRIKETSELLKSNNLIVERKKDLEKEKK